MKNYYEVSVVIPVYKNQIHINELFLRLKKTLSSALIDYEIIFINDGSPDDSWDLILEISRIDDRVKGISLSKNYGQHQAIQAGLDFVRGNWTVVMDCDLQDSPEDIPLLYRTALDYGVDLVLGQRVKRKDNVFTRISSWAFYSVYNLLIDFEYDSKTSNFGIFSKKTINAVRKFRENDQSFGYLVNTIGFKKIAVPVTHGKRVGDKSSYTFLKKLNLSLDLIISNSSKPMKIVITVGFLLSILSLLVVLYLVAIYFKYGTLVPGWFSLATILFMQIGIITFFFGVIGLYVHKVYLASKNRPNYIISEFTSTLEQ